MPKVRIGGNGTVPGSSLWLWCPGCEDAHRIVIGTADSWTWDGNAEAPTISPSIAVGGVQWDEGSPFHRPGHHVAPGEPKICHSFVVAGVWQFLGDSTHALAGQHVPMVDLPDWFSTD
jgi:hypothetical protein